MDKLLKEAAKLVVERQLGSTSLLQQKLGIKFSRAQSIMETLELMGIVEIQPNGKPAKVLVNDLSLYPFLNYENVAARMRQMPYQFVRHLLTYGIDKGDGINLLFTWAIEAYIDKFKQGPFKELTIIADSTSIAFTDTGEGLDFNQILDLVEPINCYAVFQIINAFSESFCVISHREEKEYTIIYEKGEMKSMSVSPEKKENEGHSSGTTIIFTLDKEIFYDAEYRADVLKEIVAEFQEKAPDLKMNLLVSSNMKEL